ncbi:MAG: cation-translocating P-type ATPase [Fimbriimonadaceae bacterium]
MSAKVQGILTAICGLGLIGALFHPMFGWLAVIAGGFVPLEVAYQALRERSVSVSVLMVLAAVGALVVGAVVDAGILLFLFSLSGTLEEFALGRTKSAIEGLIKLRPETAVRVVNGVDERVQIQALAIHDIVRIAPFEMIPVDGTITQGTTQINESSMTGESIPVTKTVEDGVFSGTQNLDGLMLISVTAPVGSTALDRIVELVQDAQENKASGERVSQWFGSRYTWFVLAAFSVAFLGRLALGNPSHKALYDSIVLLVALSPCALVISTPAATLSALAAAARRGILVRGGQHFENLGRIKVVAVDKTGTLTTGKPKLVEICVCKPVAAGGVCLAENSCWHGEDKISPESAIMLRAAAAAEQYSTHPIAEAIVRTARSLGVEVPEALEQSDKPGYGVTARIGDGMVRIGQRKFFENLPPEFATHVEELQASGLTVAILEFDGGFAALGLRDEPRPDAKAILQDLMSTGIESVVMMTGDTTQTAKSVAEELGIKEWHASLLPQDKTALIEDFEQAGKPVMMVGDGINDAPSLSRATVGVAMGGLGSDIALNAADIVLMNDKLSALPDLIKFGRRASRIIWANLLFATGIILVLVLTSFFGKLPLPLAVLGHEGSTVLVILNGLRLLRGP